MNPLISFLSTHWLALVLMGASLVPGVFHFWKKKEASWLSPWLLGSAALLLLGLGDLLLDRPAFQLGSNLENPVVITWAHLLATGAGLTLFVMLLVVVLSSAWWRPLGFAAGALLLLGLGGLSLPPLTGGLVEAGRTLASLEAGQPWWLFLLLLVPLLIAMSFRSLAGLGSIRRWLAIALRCSLVIFLALALAEVRIAHQNETTTVLFVVDRSFSVPQETYADPLVKGQFQDHRWDRIRKFINDAVENRGPARERDQAGLIVFGRRPRLELPPSNAPRFRFSEVASTIDGNNTDIAAALKQALASFPEGTGKRIVLISDGNENLGNAEEQARLAKQNGVQIDTVPLAAGERNESEILVQSIEAPPLVQQGTQLPLRVLLRNQNPFPVRGILTVQQTVVEDETHTPDRIPEDKKPAPKKPDDNDPLAPREVTLAPGLTTITFKQPAIRDKSYTYEAKFVPLHVLTPEGARTLMGDRVENNTAQTHVVTRGQRRILLVEPREGDHRNLVRELRLRKVDILPLGVETLPKDKDRLAVLLSNFDCLILANLPADTLSEDQQETIRSNTHEQGCGLVMIGGPDSFGAGGWQNTPVEKALPVDADLKALKVQGKGGLVLIMHACEMADGNYWEKKIAKLAIDKLSSSDEVGVLQFSWGGHKWHIPLGEIGDKRNWLMKRVDSLTPGDMPDFDGPLQMAHKELTDPARELAAKHIIIISDGDPQLTNQQILNQMRRDRVTVSTVGVATHGAPQAQALLSIARATNGRFHNVTSPKMLPAVYIKETRLVSQSFLYERRFQPQVVFRSGPAEGLPDPPPLHGFVRTTPKQSALVEVPIESPAFAEQKFPILAYWHYGLGKSVAFTSDARTQPGHKFWDRDWAESQVYGKFWEQVIDWALRPTESKSLVMSTEFRDGKVKVIVDARDDKDRPIINLNLRGGVTTPSGKAEGQGRLELKFEQKNSGVYEAEFKADEAGSYFINAQATRQVKRIGPGGQERVVEEAVDSVRSGVTIPYSPEYTDLESNTPLLRRLSELTGGQAYLEKPRTVTDGKPVPGYEVIPEDAPTLDQAVRNGDVFRPGLPTMKNLQPVWYWLLFLTAALLFLDVAVRRIAVDPAAVVKGGQDLWEHLRGRVAVADKQPEYFDRLRSRKAEVGKAMVGGKASRRFEAGECPVAAPAEADVLREPESTQSRTTAAPKPAARSKAEEGDYLSRLQKAKQRAMQQHEPEKKED